MTARARCERRDRASAWSRRSMNRARLGRPVRVSYCASRPPGWLDRRVERGADEVGLAALMTLKPELVPFPIIALIVIAGVAHLILIWSPYGAVLRGIGGNA